MAARLAATLAALVLSGEALAKPPAMSTLSPVCLTKGGAALFLLEQTEDCGSSDRRCRATRWAWAVLKPAAGTWENESIGEAVLDEASAPESNAQAARQLFKSPAAHPCAEYLRAPRLRSPDLPDSEAWFQYSVEKGALAVHWQGQRQEISSEVKLWRVSWCAKGCEGREGPREDPKPLDAGLSVVGGPMTPTIEVGTGAEALLGFQEPAGAASERATLLVRVPQARLREAQARLLYQDAHPLVAKADLFATSRAAGLLDAALQLWPGFAEARLDYARLLANGGDATRAVRELQQLKATRELRATLEADRALDSIRKTPAFAKLLESLPK